MAAMPRVSRAMAVQISRERTLRFGVFIFVLVYFAFPIRTGERDFLAVWALANGVATGLELVGQRHRSVGGVVQTRVPMPMSAQSASPDTEQSVSWVGEL